MRRKTIKFAERGLSWTTAAVLALASLFFSIAGPGLGRMKREDSKSAAIRTAFQKSAQEFAGNLNTWGVAAADIDGDGSTDIVLATLVTPSLILLNDGRGGFRPSGQALPNEMHDVAIGDFDGDGDQDLFFAPIRNQRGPLFFNDGRGRFETAGLRVDSSESVQSIDWDGDGDLDVYLGRNSRIFLNDGRGNFAQSRLPVPGYSVLADLNGDAFPDVLGSGERDGETGFLVGHNDRRGGGLEHLFLPKKDLIFCAFDFADIDRDGDLDVLYANSGEDVSRPSGILLNDGTGGLTEGGQDLPPATIYGRIKAGDLNGDGFPDLVISRWNAPAQVWLNDGRGRFIDSGLRLDDGPGWSNVVLADFDGDRDSDIFIVNRTTGHHALWFNRMNPTRNPADRPEGSGAAGRPISPTNPRSGDRRLPGTMG